MIRARLEAVREALLAVHKSLLVVARAEYENEHGPIASPSALLQLLIQDDSFAWLHPVSELASRADELSEENEVPAVELDALAKTLGELLTPNENGTGFAKKYFDAIQGSPDVALAHASARRAVRSLR